MRLPQGLKIELRDGQAVQDENGDLRITGPVTITLEDTRFQADRVVLTQGRYMEAEGNVLLVWGANRIAGRRMSYDLKEKRGTIWDAIGQVMPDYLFWAKQAEKVGDSTIRVKSATVTTCTQPIPYWSFSVSSATIRLEHYARMWNVRFRAAPLPILYLPYLVWPVKSDRAAGLLFPEFSSSRYGGRSVTQDYFIPIGRSADLTLQGRYYTDIGFGGGMELRVIPNSRGSAKLNGVLINDRKRGTSRHRAAYNQTQQFSNGFRMVADINLVSDFEYFSDFERDLSLVSSPTILARMEFSRNGPWTSLNVREQRREQLFSSGQELVQQTLPEIEWRGRSRRLGKTPFYLSFESSLASIQQRGQQQGQTIDADYRRADAFPTITIPWTPAHWLDITPRFSYRVSYYTQRQEQRKNPGGGPRRVIVNDSLIRTLGGAGVELVGPKAYRIFGRPNRPNATRYKHVIEPRLSYTFQEAFDRTDEILLYDEVDRFAGAGEQASYRIIQRLFAKRPRTETAMAPTALEPIVLPDGQTLRGSPTTAPALETLPASQEAVEIASLELRQTHSFERDLSLADLDGDGINESNSRFSDISLIGRYNPSPATSLDLRSSYNILYDRISNVSTSGTVRNKLARVRFSVVHRNGLGVRPTTQTAAKPTQIFVPNDDDTQVRLTTGLSLFRNKLKLDLDTSFDADPAPGQTHFPDKRWRMQYSTQCCTVMVEQLLREFSTLADRRDLYFRIDLKGVGKILDLSY